MRFLLKKGNSLGGARFARTKGRMWFFFRAKPEKRTTSQPFCERSEQKASKLALTYVVTKKEENTEGGYKNKKCIFAPVK
jgi:hypothetical protein